MMGVVIRGLKIQLNLLTTNEENMRDLTDGLLSEQKAHYLAAVRKDGLALANVPSIFKTDDICLAAVKENSAALQYVPTELKT